MDVRGAASSDSAAPAERRGASRPAAPPRGSGRHGGRRAGSWPSARSHRGAARRGPCTASWPWPSIPRRSRPNRCSSRVATSTAGRWRTTAGDRVAVVAWDHPDMPWDAGELCGAGHRSRRRMTPVGEPRSWPAAPASRWASRPGSPTGACASSRTGGVGGSPTWRTRPLERPGSAGHSSPRRPSSTGPDWVLGQATMAELPGGSLVLRRTATGYDDLVVLDPAHRTDRGRAPALRRHRRGLRARRRRGPDRRDARRSSAIWVWRPGGKAAPVRGAQAGGAPSSARRVWPRGSPSR